MRGNVPLEITQHRIETHCKEHLVPDCAVSTHFDRNRKVREQHYDSRKNINLTYGEPGQARVRWRKSAPSMITD